MPDAAKHAARSLATSDLQSDSCCCTLAALGGAWHSVQARHQTQGHPARHNLSMCRYVILTNDTCSNVCVSA